MNILNKLEEGNIYEVLIATENGDGTLNIKPFGVKFEEQHFVLHLFPNKTLFNIKQKKSFTVYFTNDVLAYTNALFGLLDDFDKDFAVECEVENISSDQVADSYGKNIAAIITAKVIKIIEHDKTLPIINRATNHIIDLLVEFSRYSFMDVDKQTQFVEKIESTENIINKCGNKKHKKALNLIKKELKQE